MCFSDKGDVKKHKGPKDLDFVGKEPPKDGVLGWRAWRVVRRGDHVELQSPIQSGKTWVPGKPMEAHTKIVADAKANGVYAITNLKTLQSYYSSIEGKDVVIGQVLLYGDVAHHKDGARGQYAYPFRVWTNDFTIEVALRDTYHCSVKRLPGRVLVADAKKAA